MLVTTAVCGFFHSQEANHLLEVGEQEIHLIWMSHCRRRQGQGAQEFRTSQTPWLPDEHAVRSGMNCALPSVRYAAFAGLFGS